MLKTNQAMKRNFLQKTMEQLIDLKKLLYYRDKEEFEEKHIKIVGTAFYISILSDGSIVRQTEDKLVASYNH